MHILTPPRGSGENFQTPERSTIVVDELIADGAILEVSRAADKQPLKFSFHSFDLSNIGSKGPASFQAKFSNPEPPGEITTSGKFGPWSADDLGKTAVSGEYWFQQADLSVFQGIAGLLSSSGKFSGMLDHIDVQGQTDIPNFCAILPLELGGDHFALFNQSITSVEFPTWLRPRQPSEDRIAIASAKGERPVSADLSLAALHPPRSR